MSEEWRPVVGYEGTYEVSNLGAVRSLRRSAAGYVMKPRVRSDGHLQLHLSGHGGQRTFLVHRLVMLAFVGQPEPGQEVCHNNGDPVDNRLQNLRWDTRTANAADKRLHGTVYQHRVTACPQGHAYTAENTYRDRAGKRSCRECRRESYRHWCQRRRELGLAIR